MLSSARSTSNIGNEHDHYEARPVGENVVAHAAEERQAYARYLPSLRAVADHYRRDLSEVLADVDVVKNVSGADFANCLRAEVNVTKVGWVVARNGAVAR